LASRLERIASGAVPEPGHLVAVAAEHLDAIDRQYEADLSFVALPVHGSPEGSLWRPLGKACAME
jgi:hypothetical protein